MRRRCSLSSARFLAFSKASQRSLSFSGSLGPILHKVQQHIHPMLTLCPVHPFSGRALGLVAILHWIPLQVHCIAALRFNVAVSSRSPQQVSAAALRPNLPLSRLAVFSANRSAHTLWSFFWRFWRLFWWRLWRRLFFCRSFGSLQLIACGFGRSWRFRWLRGLWHPGVLKSVLRPNFPIAQH